MLLLVIPAKAGIQGRFMLSGRRLRHESAIAVAVHGNSRGAGCRRRKVTWAASRRMEAVAVATDKAPVKRATSLDPRLRGDDEQKRRWLRLPVAIGVAFYLRLKASRAPESKRG